MRLTSFLLRMSPAMVVTAVLAGLVAGFSNTALLVLINRVLGAGGTASGRLVWAFVGCCLLMFASRSASSIMLAYLSRWGVFQLRLRLCRQIIKAPLHHLEELGEPRLLASITDDIPAIATALTSIPVLCMHAAIIASCLFYLAWLSLPVFFGVACFMALAIISYALPLGRAQHHLGISREYWDGFLAHVRGLILGTKEIKLNRKRRGAFFSEVLEPTATSLRRHGFIGDRIFAVVASWGHLLAFILIGLLLFGLPLLQRGDASMLTGYALIILYMLIPLETIITFLPVLGRAEVALQKVEALGLSLEEKAVEPESASAAPEGFRTLELAGITHTYYREGQERSFQLGPIELNFRPGELVFLVGSNGSGKTTFAKLLTGLYRPEGGEVRLDGAPVTDENREQYRQLFSAVFTDFHLFEMLLGLEQVDDQVREYLARFNLSHKVEVKGNVLSTTELSQGQRKRLALIAAYLEDRPFYVFDEWAADQDPHFKQIFYYQLLPELKAAGKTVLVISHDDRYYHVADYLVRLDEGKVVEDVRDESPHGPRALELQETVEER